MKENFHKHWIDLLLLFAFIIGVVSVHNFWQDVGQPFAGFLTNANFGLGAWEVNRSTPSWWLARHGHGLSPGDKLLTLNGIPYTPGPHNHDQEIYAVAYHGGDRTVTVEVEHQGQKVKTESALTLFSVADFLDFKLPDMINGLIFWLLAVLVYRTRPADPVNRTFAVAAALVAIHRWSLFPTIFASLDLASNLLWYIPMLVAPFIGTLTIHFALLFPRPARSPFMAALPLLHLFGATLVGIAAVERWLWWQFGWSPLINLLDQFSYTPTLYLLVIAVMLLMSRYVWLWVRERSSRRLRRQLTFILWGFSLALPMIVITVLDGLYSEGTQAYFLSGIDLRHVLLFIPLAFTFVILRYQTFHRVHPLLLYLVVLTIGALWASVGSWSLRWPFVSQAGVHAPTPYLVMFLVIPIAILSWNALATRRGILGRILDRKGHSYEAVRQFGQRVISQGDSTALPPVISSSLVTELELERAAVFLWHKEPSRFELAGQDGNWETPLPTLLPISGNSVPGPSVPIRLELPGASLPKWLEPLEALKSIAVVVPLSMPSTPVGLLVLGKRWDEEIFDDRDLEIVELIAQQATLFLLTSQQVNELRLVPRRIVEAQERERYRIAQELHDTVQQFLGRLPFFLEVGRNSIQTDPQRTNVMLERCIDDVESAAQTLRQIRHNVASSQLEKGLLQPLRELVERYRVRNGINIHLDTASHLDNNLSVEVRHALYRVIQQALDNVIAHARASLVTIALSEDTDRLTFAIADDGCGSSEEERTEAQKRGSFGLQSMNARVSALGGEFQFISSNGSGTQICGWLPIRQIAVSQAA
jgi:signal transduction histidine kinase